jgi:nitrate/TMAO reductase-like tetraheme cytochrome c subunit
VREVNGKPVCLICHIKTPDLDVDLTATVRFRADVGFLCWRCHPHMPGEFFRLHFLAVPSEKVLNNMNKAEERLCVILPFFPKGRITCSTCHNPHQDGVIQRASAAKEADMKGKLRSTTLCFACHEI